MFRPRSLALALLATAASLAALPGPQVVALIEASESEREVVLRELSAPCVKEG